MIRTLITEPKTFSYPEYICSLFAGPAASSVVFWLPLPHALGGWSSVVIAPGPRRTWCHRSSGSSTSTSNSLPYVNLRGAENLEYFFNTDKGLWMLPALRGWDVTDRGRRTIITFLVRNRHDLRHTHATMLLMDHYSPAYVQKQLGHSSISITGGYLRPLDSGGREEGPGKNRCGDRRPVPGQDALPWQGEKKNEAIRANRHRIARIGSSGFVASNAVSSGPKPGQTGTKGQKKRRNPLRLRLN